MVTKVEPRLPKGMRDLLPEEMIRRRYVIEQVEAVFAAYGFEPLGTPALELWETLMGKYGPDAEKLIYHCQHPEGRERLALRYDLSVPLARVVAMHQELPRPFRRYQIAPVWRAERPQRGRFREFVQCDADIVGTASVQADAEILQVICEVLGRLGFAHFVVRLNNRKILNGLGAYAGVPATQLGGLYRAIDKLERIGLPGVEAELQRQQVPPEAIRRLLALLEVSGDPAAVLADLRRHLDGEAEALEGIAELEEILATLEEAGVPRARLRIEPAMVRGLEYYTGPIYETVVEQPRIGSLTGGGRYDRLVGLFAGREVPATGTTIGIERILEVMKAHGMFPPTLRPTTVEVLVTVFQPELRGESLRLAQALRAGGLRCEVVLEPRSLTDQLRYANRRRIPVAVVVGPEEVRTGTVQVRHLERGEQRTVARGEAAAAIRAWLADRGGPVGGGEAL